MSSSKEHQHVLILPYPAQGHVIPLMELSHSLVDHGFKITFINTEFNHERVLDALKSETGSEKIDKMIQLVTIPNGLGPDDDHNDLGKLCESCVTVMPKYLEEIMRENGINWMIADKNMAWALDVARDMGIRAAAFWPAAAALLATMMSIPKLIEDEVIDDDDGRPKKRGMIKICQGMPPMDPAQFSWNNVGDSKTQKIVFRYVTNNVRAVKQAEFIICNSFYDLESAVFCYMPSLLPMGPVMADQTFEKPVGNFWPKDTACIDWLNKQTANSVVYVAFGSFTILEKNQFQELALGLELMSRPFLWVVRPGLTNEKEEEFWTGFRNRVSSRGMIVDWSPQKKVLAHPSVACFVSHCGWNSTIEGIRNGVPFLCRPYFCDQFLNESYICDVWRIGLRMDPDESGVMLKEQIKEKVEKLLGAGDMKERSLKWKEMTNNSVKEGGSSYKNFNSFISAMKTATAV